MSTVNKYNPLLLSGAKRLKLKKRLKLTDNLVTPQQELAFKNYTQKKMHLDTNLAILMRELWKRKRRTDTMVYLGDYYESAFEEYLTKHRIPKTIPKLNRQTRKIMMSLRGLELLVALSKIAKKRNQHLSSIIEESLREFLDKPENYLGLEFIRKEKMQRLG